MDLGSLFGTDMQRGPNGTFLAGVKRGGALAGEADVMQISGVGTPPQLPPDWKGPVAVTPVQDVSVVGSPALAPNSLRLQLMQPVTIGPITLPLAGWLAIAALLGGAGGYYLGRR